MEVNRIRYLLFCRGQVNTNKLNKILNPNILSEFKVEYEDHSLRFKINDRM